MQKKNPQINNQFPKIQKSVVQHQHKFYQILNNIANRLQFRDSDGSYAKRYKLNAPFMLKKLYDCEVVLIKTYRFPQNEVYFPKPEKIEQKIIIIHVTQGALEIVRKKQIDTLSAPGTYFIDTHETNIVGRVKITPTNITIIVQKCPKTITNFKKIASPRNIKVKKPCQPIEKSFGTRSSIQLLNPLTNAIKPIPITKNKLPVSFIRADLTQEEINKRTIFLDAEFVQTNKKQAPGSATILDFDGKIIFNEIIKPTEKVTEYVSFITGFNKQKIDKGMPEIEALKRIHEIVEGKILVGSDLTQDLTILKINKNKLLGIRDLSTAKVIRKKMQTFTQKIGLKRMVAHFFKIKLHDNIHTSLEDTNYIRKVYCKVLNEYEDDFYTTESEEDINSLNTPLLDEMDLDFENTAENNTNYDLEPASDMEFEREIPKETLISEKEANNANIGKITIVVPENITTTDGRVLIPERIVYAEPKSCNNTAPNNFRITFDYML